jgi:hypothetical protein
MARRGPWRRSGSVSQPKGHAIAIRNWLTVIRRGPDRPPASLSTVTRSPAWATGRSTFPHPWPFFSAEATIAWAGAFMPRARSIAVSRANQLGSQGAATSTKSARRARAGRYFIGNLPNRMDRESRNGAAARGTPFWSPSRGYAVGNSGDCADEPGPGGRFRSGVHASVLAGPGARALTAITTGAPRLSEPEAGRSIPRNPDSAARGLRPTGYAATGPSVSRADLPCTRRPMGLPSPRQGDFSPGDVSPHMGHGNRRGPSFRPEL